MAKVPTKFPVKFPKDNQTALIAYFGDPGKNEPGQRLVTVKLPFVVWYGKKKVTEISLHELAAESFKRAFEKIWLYYHKDQKLLDKLEISNYSGAYAHRFVRGSTTKWSNHAYGTAYDMDAVGNELGKLKGTIPMPVVAAFKSEGIAWGGDYTNRKDWMHFEACTRSDPVWTFEQWLSHYGCPPMGAVKAEVKTAPASKPPEPEVAASTQTMPAPDKPKEATLTVGKPAPATPAVKPAPTPAPAKPPVTIKTPAAPVDPFDHDDTPEPAADGVPLKGVFSIKTQVVQTVLDQLGYHNVGELDGKWGGATTGAIAAFKNDRHLSGEVTIDDELEAELEKAQAEGWKRPIAEERAKATAAQLTDKLPEVKAADTVERVTFWSSITAGISATVTGVMKMMGDAIEMLNPVKEWVGNMPWYVWVGGALAVAISLYLVSRRAGDAKNAATTAYNEGART